MQDERDRDGDAIAGIINGVLVMAVIVMTIHFLTGCGGTTGWSVGFGVHPVTAVDNHQTLATRESRYASKGDSTNASETR